MLIRKNSQTIKRDFELITVDGVKGLILSNIKNSLSPQLFAQFRSWLIGQTVGVYQNETFVYEHDFKRFMAGLPSLD